LSRQAGFDAHLVKPVEPAEIRQVLEGYLGLVTEGEPRPAKFLLVVDDNDVSREGSPKTVRNRYARRAWTQRRLFIA
jgi:hypothetical protein